MAKSGWDLNPTAFVKTVREDLTERQKEISIDALRLVIMSSPVDQGAYKANHRVTVDSEDYGFDPSAYDPSGQTALSLGEDQIMSISEGPHVVRISNSIPYGEVLENGHSMQAPQGVYGPAFATLVAKYGGNR